MRRAGLKRTASMAGALLAALVLMAGSPADARPGRGGMASGPRPGPNVEGMVCSRLDLSEDQQAKIREIHEGKRQEHLRLQKEVLRLQNALDGEMLKDSPSTATLRDLAGQIGSLRTQEMILRLETRVAVRGVLTPEQRDRQLTLRGGRHHGHGPGLKDGPAGRGGQRGSWGHNRGDCQSYGWGPRAPWQGARPTAPDSDVDK